MPMVGSFNLALQSGLKLHLGWFYAHDQDDMTRMIDIAFMAI